jgi:hypothetical protein
MSKSRSSILGLACGLLLVAAGGGLSTLAVAQPQPGGWRDAQPQMDGGGSRTAPDPPPIRSSEQYVLTFRYNAGQVTYLGAQHATLPQARATPRVAGRYAVELLSGPTVVERVRFDFPLLGADELAGRRREYNAPPRFETRAVVTYRVLVPDSSRFSHARLVDRATGRVWTIAWPPEQGSDAGLARPAAPRDAGDEGWAPADGAPGWPRWEAGGWDVEAESTPPDAGVPVRK